LRFLAAPNGIYRGIRQAPIPVVKPVVVAPLNRGVSVVVGNRPYAQVFWAHALRVVASVHDHLARWNLPYKGAVNDSVRLCASSILAAASRNETVSRRASITRPQPASWSFFDPRREVNWSKYARIFRQCSALPFGSVVEFAQVSAERLFVAKQAFLFSLFHGYTPQVDVPMTLP
jgi:hypothetical protein